MIRLKVLILPMRNGNFFPHDPPEEEEKVLILPMRNGNVSLCNNTNAVYYLVLILPMRNGNGVRFASTGKNIIEFLSYL